MPKPFDAALKALLEESPDDWPVLAGLPRQPTDVIDADISTVTGAADKELRVRGGTPLIVHLEFQTRADVSLPRRIHVYNAILEHRHGLPVLSVLLLLSPRADHANLSETYERGLPGKSPYLTFRYQVIRVWQERPERFLSGGGSLVPLAPISAVTETEVPGVLQRMKDRLRGERLHAGDLWTATRVLMGLRYKAAFVEQMLEGVLGMEESVTYQAIKREGRREGALAELRKVILNLGRIRFGHESAAVKRTLLGITEIQQLEDLVTRAIAVDSWQRLLESYGARPAAQKGEKRRANPSEKTNGGRTEPDVH